MDEHEGLPDPEAPSQDPVSCADEEPIQVNRNSLWSRLVGEGGEHDPIIIKSNV